MCCVLFMCAYAVYGYQCFTPTVLRHTCFSGNVGYDFGLIMCCRSHSFLHTVNWYCDYRL